jgi:hypothetical protein
MKVGLVVSLQWRLRCRGRRKYKKHKFRQYIKEASRQEIHAIRCQNVCECDQSNVRTFVKPAYEFGER